MNELIKKTIANIDSYKAAIARNKKYSEYPFTNNCDHYYHLLLLQNRLENWERFLALLEQFKNSRCVRVEKKSELFHKIINVEKNSVPGFVTMETLNEMLEYMKKLEWKLEELDGIWKKDVS
ncbi:hypothetical protein ACT8ZS_19625 [Paenibacillus sp. M.A.Huq-84]